jgi:hypothetical protein
MIIRRMLARCASQADIARMLGKSRMVEYVS